MKMISLMIYNLRISLYCWTINSIVKSHKKYSLNLNNKIKRKKVMTSEKKLIVLLGLSIGLFLNMGYAVDADSGVDIGAFHVNGGVEGTDFSYTSGVLTILSSQSLTIRNQNPSAATTDRIVIPENVKANLTFAGVNISTTANSPFTLTPDSDNDQVGASAYIILADNTENKLISKDGDYPGLRCGKTTSVYIDDSVVNKDSQGNDIIPEFGKVPYDVTLLNGTRLKKGTRLTAMDSSYPGKLNTIGNDRSAGLGGGNGESAGNITINGGIIDSIGCVNSSTYYGYGAGIGGGCLGDGGNIVINGGVITSLGSYHGAGIGGGCHVDATLNRLTPQVVDWKTGYGKSGNITINGGLTYANGNTHADAFGDGCITASTPSTSSNYKIIVTGGTIISKAVGGRNDLGGSQADVYVLGGSLKANKFSSIGGKVAYGDMEKKTKVFMTKIGLDSWGIDKVATTLVDVMDMKIDGIEYDYGTPSYTDEQGLLYLWLPDAKKGSEVSVDLDVFDKSTGSILDTDTFFAKDVGNTSNGFLKQYVKFDISSSDLAANILTKRYDGLPLDDGQIVDDIAALGIKTTIPVNGSLTDASKMTLNSQKLKDDGVTIEDDAEITPGINVDGGKYQLIITSTEYATSSVQNFKDAYWGHRTYFKYAEITPADTETEITVTGLSQSPDIFRPDQKITLNARISPAKGEGANCASPKGKVQFYMNGKEIGKPVSLTAHAKDGSVVKSGAIDYNYSTASSDYKAVNGTLCVPGEKQTISAKYIGGDGNYTISEKINEYRMDSLNIDTDNDGIPDINIDIDNDGKPDVNIDSDNDFKPDINLDVDKDSKPDINIDVDNDGKPDINIDVDKDGKPDINIDVDKDGIPDINIDTDHDGKPDINIDVDNDGKPDINIDTDNTGTWKPSTEGGNEDGIWKPDTNIDADGNGISDSNDRRPPIDLDGDGVDDYWKPNKTVKVGDVEYGTGSLSFNSEHPDKPSINVDAENPDRDDQRNQKPDSVLTEDKSLIEIYVILGLSGMVGMVYLRKQRKRQD